MPERIKERSVRELAVQQVARYVRNCKYLKGLNNVLCVVRSCNKLHATYEIVNARRVKQRSVHGLVVHQDALYERANIRIAYGFYSQILAGDNQKLFH